MRKIQPKIDDTAFSQILEDLGWTHLKTIVVDWDQIDWDQIDWSLSPRDRNIQKHHYTPEREAMCRKFVENGYNYENGPNS